MTDEIIKNTVNAGLKKSEMPLVKMILLGILAGIFIAGGAASASVVMHATSNVGVARFLGGAIFPVGLIMIVIAGGELFTGDCLMIIGVLDKKYKLLSMLRVLAVVWICNFIGAFIVALFVYFSGQLGYTDGLLGAYSIKVALGKGNMSFVQGFSSGIMCNIFVCGAVLMASAAKDTTGKVYAVFFPIMAFVLSGYEHCVANMYYIPVGILAKNNESYVQKAMEAYGYTAGQIESVNWKSFFIDSSIPVTLGNMAGGIIFMGVVFYFVQKQILGKNKTK